MRTRKRDEPSGIGKCNMDNSVEDTILLDRALELAITKCLRDANRLGSFPHVTQDGDWLVSEHARWTGGFFVGMLWLAGLLREDDAIMETARSWALRLEPRASDRTTHDMGFLFEPSCVRGHNIRHLFFGHIHRPCQVVWQGIPCSALPGTNHQVPLSRERTGTSYSAEPAMYGVVLIQNDQTTIHMDAWMDRGAAQMDW